jgi:hypothetical protein
MFWKMQLRKAWPCRSQRGMGYFQTSIASLAALAFLTLFDKIPRTSRQGSEPSGMKVSGLCWALTKLLAGRVAD